MGGLMFRGEGACIPNFTVISFTLELWYKHRTLIVEITHKTWTSFKTLASKKATTWRLKDLKVTIPKQSPRGVLKWCLQLYQKKPWHKCYLWILRNFWENLFYGNTSSGCFWHDKVLWKEMSSQLSYGIKTFIETTCTNNIHTGEKGFCSFYF